MITSFNSSLHRSSSAPTLSPSFWKTNSKERRLAEKIVSRLPLLLNSGLKKESETKEAQPKIKQENVFLTYRFLSSMPKDRDLAVIQLARAALGHSKSSGQKVIQYQNCHYVAQYQLYKKKHVSIIPITGLATSRLGEGSFGIVCRTTELVSQIPLVIKFPTNNFSTKLLKREYDITKQLRDKDPFLLFFSVPFSTKRFIFFTQSLQDQDLFTLLNASSPQSLSWATRLGGCKQLFLDYFDIYDKGFCHTDLKPENILVRKKDGDLLLQIGDFGSAISHHYRPEKMEVAYVGYESVQDAWSLLEASSQNQFDAFFRRCRRRDMFALGVTLLELLIGRTLPLQAQKEWISDNRKKGILVSALKLFEQTAPPLYQPISPLLLEMTLMNPYLRPSWEDLRTRSNLLFSKFNTDKFYEEEICI